MLAARVAEFVRFQPVLMLLPVLGGRVVPVFTFGALQCDNFAHGLLDDLGDGARLGVGRHGDKVGFHQFLQGLRGVCYQQIP